MAAWIATFALLGNVVAGMFCAPPIKRDLGFPSDLLGAMVICSEHGEQTLQDDGSPPAPTKPCQICTAVASVLVPLILSVLLALLPLAPGVRLTPAFRLAATPRRWCAGLGSRAPPVLA